MKIQIKNYTFDVSAKTIVFDDYAGIDLDSIVSILNTTTNLPLYDPSNKTLTGTVATNVLTLNIENLALMNDTDDLYIIYDDPAKTQSTEESQATIIEMLNQGDYLTRVAKGLIAGASFDRKFGSIDSIQADTPADVWEYGVTSGAEKYTFSADGVADIDTISSSDADDDEELTIVGLDADGNEVTQTKALNGQAKVTLDTPLWRVNRAFNSNGTDFEGDVYIYVDGTISVGVPTVKTTVRGFISSGEGQTLQAIYTVPAGKTAYFLGLETSLTKGVGATAVNANLRGRTRDFGKVFRTQDEFNLLSSGSSRESLNFPIPLPFAEKSDFCPIADVSANGVGVSWAFTVLLIDN